MIFKRGDVVLVQYPNSDLITYKKRPALVVQADNVPTGIAQRIVAMITSNINRTGDTRAHFNKNSQEGKRMGLLSDSVVVTDNLATILECQVDKVIGCRPAMERVETALRRTLRL